MAIFLKNVRNIYTLEKEDILLNDEGDIEKKTAIDNLSQRPKTDYVIEASDFFLSSGFFNAHTHLPMIIFRSLEENPVLQKWLDNISLMEQHFTENLSYIATLAAAIELIKTGTTKFSSGYFFPEACFKAAVKTGLNASIGISISEAATPEYKTVNESMKIARKLLSQYRQQRNKRVRYHLSPHSIYRCSENTLYQIRKLSENTGCDVHIHLSETRKECVECWKKTGLWPVEYLHSIDFLWECLTVAHVSWLTKMEISLLSQNNVSAVHCPVSNMKMASGGVMPLIEMLDSGINVYIGTDGPATNNSLNMSSEGKFAALVHKAHRWDPFAITADVIYKIITKDSGGYILINAKDISMMPYHNIIQNIIFSEPKISYSFISGEPILYDGIIKTFDEEKVKEEFLKESERFIENID